MHKIGSIIKQIKITQRSGIRINHNQRKYQLKHLAFSQNYPTFAKQILTKKSPFSLSIFSDFQDVSRSIFPQKTFHFFKPSYSDRPMILR